MFIVTRGNNIQPGTLKHLQCRIFGNDMLQDDADLKTRIHFGGDIPAADLGLLAGGSQSVICQSTYEPRGGGGFGGLG